MNPLIGTFSGPYMSALFTYAATNQVRLQSIAAHGPSSAPLYTAIFHPKSGPAQSLDVDLWSVPVLEAAIALRADQGLYPKQITGTMDGQGTRFALLCEPATFSNPLWQPPRLEILRDHELGSVQGQADGADINLIGLDFLGYDSWGAAWALMLFDGFPRMREQWSTLVMPLADGAVMDRPEYAGMLRAFACPFAAVPRKPNFQAGENERLILSAWRTQTYVPWPGDMTTFTGGVTCEGPMTQGELDALVASFPFDQTWPLAVGASGAGANTRFCLLCGPPGRSKPLTRHFKAKTLKLFVPTPGNLPLPGPRPGPPSPFPDPNPEHPQPAPKARPGRSDSAIHPIVKFARRLMRDGTTGTLFNSPTFSRANGARLMQIAVQRKGKLVFAGAFTYAEDGYDEAEHGDQFRVGSVSKWLTAYGCMAYFGPGGPIGTFNVPINEALQIFPQSENYGVLLLPRVEELLRHRAGWGGSSSGTTKIDPGAIQPGQLREYLESTTTPLMPAMEPPFATAPYNNYNFSALGEILAGAMSPNPEPAQKAWGQYEDLLGAFFGYRGDPNQANRAHLFADGYLNSRELGEPICHNRVPATVLTDEGWWDGSQFRGLTSSQWWGGGTCWAISAIDLVRLGARMDPLCPQGTLLTPDQVRAFWGPYQPLFSNDTLQEGRGCYFAEVNFTLKGYAPQPFRVITHNGMIPGGASQVWHLVPKNGDAVSPSFTIAISLNHDGGVGSMTDLIGAVQTCETEDLWPDGDLFDLV